MTSATLIPVHRFITVAALLTVRPVIFLYNLIHSRFWQAGAER